MRAAITAAVLMAIGTAAPVGDAAPIPLVYVNCRHQVGAPTYSSYYTARAHPRTCVIWGVPSDLANLYTLRHLRWLGWGHATTPFTGEVRNTHPGMGGPLWSKISGRLSVIRRGCDGVRFYSRMTFPGSAASPVRLSDACRPAA